MSGAPASLNSPNPFAGHPAATRTLFFVEMWERFSYYGLGAVLVLFMASPVSVGGLGLREDSALTVYGTYASSVFLLGVPLSLLADGLLGPARAVLIGGAVITAGHVVMAMPTPWALFPGLALIAIGTGLLKPCIGSLVSGLYSEPSLRKSGMRLFYMSISIGGLLGPLALRLIRVLPWVSPGIGWHLAFASAAAGMGLGLILYSRIRGDLPSPAPAAPVRAVLAGFAVSLVAAIALGIFLLFSPHACVVYAVVVGAFVYFRFLSVHPESGRRSLLLLMLIVSIVCSSLIGQMFSSLTLLADKFVGREFLGLRMAPEYYAVIFAAFVIMCTVWLARFRDRGVWFLDVQHAIPIGIACLGLSLLMLAVGAQLGQSTLISPVWLVAAYALKAISEVLIIPAAFSVLGETAPRRQGSYYMAIWLLGAGLGNNLSKMLSIAMPKQAEGLSGFFAAECVVVSLIAVFFWAYGSRLAAQVDECRNPSV